MKKNYWSVIVLIVLSFIIASCPLPQDNDLTPLTLQEIKQQSLNRQETLAILHLADNYEISPAEIEIMLTSMLTPGTSARSAESSEITITDVTKITKTVEKGFISKTAGRSASPQQEVSEIPFYLFSLNNPTEDTTGFALTCGDIRFPSIIAVVEDGDWYADLPFMEIVRTNLDWYIYETIEIFNSVTEEDIQTALVKQSQLNKNITNRALGVPDLINEYFTPPLIEVKWGQGTPYNEICSKYNQQYNDPNESYVATGCVATAVAQILSKYEYPTTPQLNPSYIFSYGNIGYNTAYNVVYNWADMKLYPITNRVSLGVLMLDIGLKVNMDYGNEESTANSYYVPSALTSMGYYNLGLVNYNYDLIVNSIILECPVYISASYNNAKGHAWVLDGIGYQNWILEYFPGKYVTQTYLFVHCNYGWDSDCDGWYLNGIFDTSVGPIYTEPEEGGINLYNYAYNQKIIPGIMRY